MKPTDIKSHFPIFKHHPELVYLDNAATTQRPQVVLDAMNNFYLHHNANVHRGMYPLSEAATEIYEQARNTVADFLGVLPNEIVFTSGTTEGINGVAQMLKDKVKKIVVSELEHHANLLPWQQIRGEDLIYLPLNNWTIDLEALNNYPDLGAQDLIALSAGSNVTGAKLDLSALKTKLNTYTHKPLVLLDLAQVVAHQKVTIDPELVDFAVFSGHKMYGPMGIGVLYINKKHHHLEPFKRGGGIVESVTKQGASWQGSPHKFEAGTPNVAAASGLAASCKFLNAHFFQTETPTLNQTLTNQLLQLPEVKIFHPTQGAHLPILSFTVAGIHPHDIATWLGQKNICVRAGHHCTHILHTQVIGSPGTVRASFGLYNKATELDTLVLELKAAIKAFRV